MYNITNTSTQVLAKQIAKYMVHAWHLKKKPASVLALYEVYTNHRYDKQQKSTIFHIPSYKEEFQVKKYSLIWTDHLQFYCGRRRSHRKLVIWNVPNRNAWGWTCANFYNLYNLLFKKNAIDQLQRCKT